jgi:hypothetical protein
MPLTRKAGFVVAACLAFALSGCETSDMIDKMQATVQDWNPFGVTKTPLKGERRELFPQGVPGVQQGIPPEYAKGAQTIPDPNTPPEIALAPQEPEKKDEAAEKPKPKPKKHAARPKPAAPAPAPRQAKRKPAPEQPAAAEQAAPAAPQPAPQAAWPAPPAANQAPQWPEPSNQTAPTVWPEPPKPGQFSR